MFLEIYDVQVVRREVLDGNSTVLLNFKPKPNAKPKDRTMNMLHHAAVRAWVTEQEHQVVKSEFEVMMRFPYSSSQRFSPALKLSLNVRRSTVNSGLRCESPER
jgi:hypothetical protein